MTRKSTVFCAVLVFLALPVFHMELSAQNNTGGDIGFRGIERWAFRTNAFDWLLTIPNAGIEFDLSNSPYNRSTIGLSAHYNWNSYSSILPYNVFNYLKVEPEFRYYWHTAQRVDKNRRHWRANYVGAYVNGGSYSFKLSQYGRQGQFYGAGVTIGYVIPMYIYRHGAIDIDLGFSVGAAMVTSEAYALNAEANRYEAVPEMSRGLHVLPYPVVSELSVAFVWRKASVLHKYARTDQKKELIRQERKAAAAQKKMERRSTKVNADK